ncbi:MAG: GTPase ObgE [Bacilli bacterium]
MNDKVKVTLVSGKGGNGAIAFRREKSIEKGGPYGGNGGRGGSIFIEASYSTDTLANYRFGKTIKAEDGENGRTKLQYGKDSPDIILYVPIGTVIEDENGNQLADLCHEKDRYLAVKGGRGGRGNACFKTPIKRTPNIAENGFPEERKVFYFELKLLADVGLVGFPNAGKSTFLSATTRARPEIADYPFTTIDPMVGVCYYQEEKRFVIADIPGLIEGAADGKGLGFTFLRHIERCRVLLHIIDVTTTTDPMADFNKINSELFKYSPEMKNRKMVIGLNKIDGEYDKAMIEDFKDKIKGQYEVFEFSGQKQLKLKPLIKRLYSLVQEAKNVQNEIEKNSSDNEERVYSAKDDDTGVIPKYEIVKRDENVYEIVGPRVTKTKQLINLKTDEGVNRLLEYLDKIGINEELKKKNVSNGATIILDDFEFEYFE